MKKTKEEREWETYEMAWLEGYEDGVNDFAEVERRKEVLRKKGLPVLGDKK